MSDNQFEYVDRHTGSSYPTGRALINEYISRFSSTVSKATGTEVHFGLLDDDGYTSVNRGSATIGINVLEEQGVLIFLARIMKIPENRKEECFQLLLELNYTSTSDAAFAIEKVTNTICLRAHRSILSLDYDEFEDMLHSVATVADEWDDRLLAQFS